MTDTPLEEQRLSYDVELDAPPEKVWRALTVPAFIDRWLMPVERADRGRFSGRDRGERIDAEVVEAEPPRRLSWNWREAGKEAGVVTFTLTPSDSGGTLLRLVHTRRTAAAMQPAANSNAVTMMLAA